MTREQRVVIVLDSVRSLYNTGSILRTADASGVERVVLCGITPRPDQGGRQRRAIAKTALGAEESVAWEYQPDVHGALRSLAGEGYHVVAVETRSEEHTSELQSQSNLVCRLLLEKKKITKSPS